MIHEAAITPGARVDQMVLSIQQWCHAIVILMQAREQYANRPQTLPTRKWIQNHLQCHCGATEKSEIAPPLYAACELESPGHPCPSGRLGFDRLQHGLNRSVRWLEHGGGHLFTPTALCIIARGWTPEVFRRRPTPGKSVLHSLPRKGLRHPFRRYAMG